MKTTFPFIRKVIFFFIVVYGLVVGVNLLVDPAYIFRKYDTEVVSHIVEKKNVAISHLLEGVDLVSIKIIEDPHFQAPDVAVLGSSRTSEISDSFVAGKSFFNFSIPGGNLIQEIGLYSALRENHKLPKTVILNYEPWEFYPFQGGYWWINNLSGYYHKGLKVMGTNFGPFNDIYYTESTSDNVLKMLSVSTFQESLARTFSHGIFTTELKTGNLIYPVFVYRHDGSYSLAPVEKLEDGRVISDANRFIREHPGSLFGSDRLSDENAKTLLSSFIELIRKDGVRPIFFLSPLNPIVFEHFTKNDKNEVEIYGKQFAADHQIPVIGSFDPSAIVAEGNEKLFIDGIHLTSVGMQQLWKASPHNFFE